MNLIRSIAFVFLMCHPSMAQIPAGPLSVSRDAKDLIVKFETGGKSYYESRLARPSYPGGASGVTIGIGYDCGYNSRDGIIADWAALPKASRDALAGVAGIRGGRAKIAAASLRWIVVPWSSAESVFVSNSMPRFGRYTVDAFPGVSGVHGHIQGAVLSLVFNRGSSVGNTPSRREMRAIRTHFKTGEIHQIPAEIRSMKRLWIGKGLDGLLDRRDAEAALVERGLSESASQKRPDPWRSLWSSLTSLFLPKHERPGSDQ